MLWIRIRLQIRIRIGFGRLDQDIGGKKMTHKKEKSEEMNWFHVLHALF